MRVYGAGVARGSRVLEAFYSMHVATLLKGLLARSCLKAACARGSLGVASRHWFVSQFGNCGKYLVIGNALMSGLSIPPRCGLCSALGVGW